MSNQISELKRIIRQLEILKRKIINANGSNSALSYIDKAINNLEEAIEEITGFGRTSRGNF